MDLATVAPTSTYRRTDKYGRRTEISERSLRTVAVLVTIPKRTQKPGRTHFVNDRTTLVAPGHHEVTYFGSLREARAHVADIVASGRPVL
jgi:hypothetical protein